MAATPGVRLLLGGAASVGLAAAALVLPVPARVAPAPERPQDAAARAEATLPALGVLWGRVRGWERVGAGWTVSWQPTHGVWLVQAWVPDDGHEIRWRIEAAPWLPGTRLSARAARFLAQHEGEPAQARERLARRDWLFPDDRLLGALPAGGELPAQPRARWPIHEALLAGFLLAGAAVRHLVPGSPSRVWRQAVGWSVAVLLPLLPGVAAAAPAAFGAGVRPWVAELAFGAAATMLLGVLLFGAQRFPAVAGSAPAAWLPAALAAGLLAGRLAPAEWLLALAGTPLGAPALMSFAVITGWLAGLAADGVRELLRFLRGARPVALAALGVAGVALPGPWLVAAAAVVPAAAVERGKGTWLATAVVWGWVAGTLWSLAWWEAGQLDALAMLLLSAAVAAAAALRATPLPSALAPAEER